MNDLNSQDEEDRNVERWILKNIELPKVAILDMLGQAISIRNIVSLELIQNILFGHDGIKFESDILENRTGT